VADEDPDPFLRSALVVAGGLVDKERSARLPVDHLDELAAGYDVLILADDRAPESLTPGAWILLTPPPRTLGLEPLPPAETSPVWQTAAAHPVTRGVDAAEVQVAGAVPAVLPDHAEPLLAVPGGAVAAAGEIDGVRFVWLGLDPANSTLPVTGAYPLLIRNALRWFAAVRTEPLAPSYPLGAGIRPVVPLPAGTRAAAFAGPGENDRAVVEGSFTYRPASRVEGEVRMRLSDAEHVTRVNALLPGESGAEPLPGGPAFGEDRSGFRDTRRTLWPWFAVAAALFLLLEWVHYRLTSS
jgi:hypothetical protein